MPLTRAQQQLAEDYLPYARKIVKPYKELFPSMRDELESAIVFALVEAAQAFKPERGIKFMTFARHRIFGAIIDTQRKEKPHGYRNKKGNIPHLSQIDVSHEEDGMMLYSEDPPIGNEIESYEEVIQILKQLPKKHGAACREIYLNDCTHAETGRRMGLSQPRVTAIHNQSLKMLRETVTNDTNVGRARKSIGA